MQFDARGTGTEWHIFPFLALAQCCILVQFFTDFFTKEAKNQAIQYNVGQRKSLKTMQRA
jgi:hypothetical protein